MKPTGPRLAISVVVLRAYSARLGAPLISPAMITGTIAMTIMMRASGRTRTRQSNGFHQRYLGPRSICWYSRGPFGIAPTGLTCGKGACWTDGGGGGYALGYPYGCCGAAGL